MRVPKSVFRYVLEKITLIINAKNLTHFWECVRSIQKCRRIIGGFTKMLFCCYAVGFNQRRLKKRKKKVTIQIKNIIFTTEKYAPSIAQAQ
jgi:hypothetical protein